MFINYIIYSRLISTSISVFPTLAQEQQKEIKRSLGRGRGGWSSQVTAGFCFSLRTRWLYLFSGDNVPVVVHYHYQEIYEAGGRLIQRSRRRHIQNGWHRRIANREAKSEIQLWGQSIIHSIFVGLRK